MTVSNGHFVLDFTIKFICPLKPAIELVFIFWRNYIVTDKPPGLVFNFPHIDITPSRFKSLVALLFSRINLEGQDAIVPDLDRLTHLITHATYGALPITHIDD